MSRQTKPRELRFSLADNVAENSTEQSEWKEAPEDVGLKVRSFRYGVDPGVFWREFIRRATASSELATKFRSYLAKRHAEQLELLDKILALLADPRGTDSHTPLDLGDEPRQRPRDSIDKLSSGVGSGRDGAGL